MKMDTLNVTFTGTTSLLMHANRGVNPFDPQTKEMKALTSKRKKTEEDLAATARLEWELGLYYDPQVGPYIPAEMILACIRDAARKTKQGKLVIEAAFVNEMKIPLNYRGPRKVDDLYADGHFVDSRPVRVQQARINRCRPVFMEWGISFSLDFDSELIDRGDLINILQTAGQRIGLGDYRPTFGRFLAEVA